MSLHTVAAALERVQAVLHRRPEMGPHDDAPATTTWMGGTRMVSSHANGTRIESDMPSEFGGSGDRITPGWLFRAGAASCAATTLVMASAAQGLTLTRLEVQVESRSDTRGLLGLADEQGQPVYAGPGAMQLKVHIAAEGLSAAQLRAFVEDAIQRSPIPCAVRRETALALHVDTVAG